VIPGLLSRPCARMETEMVGFVIAFVGTLMLVLLFGMLGFGPRILEWIEGEPT
jgi:hypothetical protein